MERLHFWINVAFLCISAGSGAQATSPEIIGLAVSGSLSFVLLFFVVFMIAVSFSWGDWMKDWMRARGKVKMPKAYFKKKEEAKRRLISGAASQASLSQANGHLPAQTVDRASWVQGWSQRSNAYTEGYEEKDVALDFGPEQDDEFKIETVLCDDEVLDVGPYKTAGADEQATSGDVYPDPYIYTSIDKTARTSVRKEDQPSTSADVETSININNFEDNLVKL